MFLLNFFVPLLYYKTRQKSNFGVYPFWSFSPRLYIVGLRTIVAPQEFGSISLCSHGKLYRHLQSPSKFRKVGLLKTGGRGQKDLTSTNNVKGCCANITPVPCMVGNVGVGPLFRTPNAVCYPYTTSP